MLALTHEIKKDNLTIEYGGYQGEIPLIMIRGSGVYVTGGRNQTFPGLLHKSVRVYGNPPARYTQQAKNTPTALPRGGAGGGTPACF